MLAISSKLTPYDIDGFISQILTSKKFDELSEIMAEKAANKILDMQAAPGSVTKNTRQIKQSQDVKLTKDHARNIGAKADMTTSQSDNLKFKYLKKQTVMKGYRDPDSDPSKHNEETETADKLEDHDNKTIAHSSNQEATDNANQEHSGETMRLQDDRPYTHDRKHADAKRNSDSHDILYSADDEINENSKNLQLKKRPPGSQQANSNESHDSVPQFKDILKEEPGNVRNIRKNEKIQKFLTHSEENSNERIVDKSEEVRRHDKESVEDKNSGAANLRVRDESSDYNKVTMYSPYGSGMHRSSSSEVSGRSAKRNYRSHEETMDRDQGDVKYRPVVKREGDKLFRYVEAPEYKDYHEEMVKWRKVHPENPVDFM